MAVLCHGEIMVSFDWFGGENINCSKSKNVFAATCFIICFSTIPIPVSVGLIFCSRLNSHQVEPTAVAGKINYGI